MLIYNDVQEVNWCCYHSVEYIALSLILRGDALVASHGLDKCHFDEATVIVLSLP